MGNNDSSVETFLQWIKASDNIVFFGGNLILQKSDDSTNYGDSDSYNRGSIRRSFTDSTVTRCSVLMQSRTSRITSLQSLKKQESLRAL